jgi:hypothetical protein
VMQTLAQAGGTLVRWPVRVAGTDDAPAREPTASHSA